MEQPTKLPDGSVQIGRFAIGTINTPMIDVGVIQYAQISAGSITPDCTTADLCARIADTRVVPTYTMADLLDSYIESRKRP